MSGRLSNDEFLTCLTTLLSAPHNSGHGSVYLTQKPLPSDLESSSPDSTPTPSGQILIRATNGVHKPKKANIAKSLKGGGKKVKLSTVVEEAELEGFYSKYAEVCKRGMEGLRKRDKKKAKAKEKAKKKKGKDGKGS